MMEYILEMAAHDETNITLKLQTEINITLTNTKFQNDGSK